MNKRHNPQADSELIFLPGDVEIRSRADGDGEVIFGYWSKYNQRSHVMKTKKGVPFVEIVRPGAFDRTDFSELESRFNHENILAAPPTLRYGFDQVGAWYEIPVDPLDPDHMGALRKIKRGDVKGSSFEFSSPGPNDQIVSNEGGVKLREITHFPKVVEFGPVIVPAYPSTNAFVRSLDQQEEIDLQAQQDFQDRKIKAKKFLASALS